MANVKAVLLADGKAQVRQLAVGNERVWEKRDVASAEERRGQVVSWRRLEYEQRRYVML